MRDEVKKKELSNSRLVTSFKLFSQYTGVFVALVGGMVIIGWMFDVSILKSIHPHLVAMKANTALAFMLVGVSLYLLQTETLRSTIQKRKHDIAQACALLVSLIGLLSLSEYLFGVNLGIDQLLFKEAWGAVGTSNPGRMAPNTAINFLLIGMALLLLDVKARSDYQPAQLLVLPAGLIGLFAFLGYIYGVSSLYRLLPAYTQMALHTAVLFVLIFLSILFARPDRGWTKLLVSESLGGFMLQRLLPVSIVILLSLGGLRIAGERAGLYDSSLGTSINTTVKIVIFVLMLWFFSNSLHRTDSQRLKAEEDLRAVSFYSRSLIEASLDPLVTISTEGKIMDVNKATELVTGVPRERLIGTVFSDYFTQPEKARHGYKRVFRDGMVRDYPLAIRHTSGIITEVIYNASIYKDQTGKLLGVFGAARDITERKRMEKALHDSEEKYRLITENASDWISLVNAEGNFTYLSPSCERMTGYAPEEFLKDAGLLTRVLHPEDRSAYETYHNEAWDNKERHNFEFRIISRTGEIRWIDHICEPVLTDEGKYLGRIGMNRDVTKRRLAEENLKTTLEHLEHSNKDLEQFAYVASHDLQEPLRMVASYTQLLEKRYKDKLDSDATEFIQYAVDGAIRMQRLINDLLVYSRLGTRGKPFQPTDIHEVLGQAISNLSASIEENQAVVTNDDLPPIMADESQMVQLFQNLIGNAIKFRGDETPHIHVSAEQKEDEWLFSVRDNGIGIGPQHKDRIFVIFQRLHSKEKYPGTGIGLAICKKIVERHGGRIWVESEPRKGSTFYFSIPATGRKKSIEAQAVYEMT